MFSNTRLTSIYWVALATLILFGATLSRAADAPTQVSTEDLGGPERYLAYVSTDKPIYRAGEKVYLRTVILNAQDNTPLANSLLVTQIKITGPKGDVIHEGQSHGTDSAAGYSWEVPAGSVGGEYTAIVSSPALGLAETSRVFDIRAYRAPRMKTQIQFTRDGYGAGDQVRASVSIERAEGGVPEQASISAIARLDGKEIFRTDALQISSAGIVNTSFNLPDEITVGTGSLSFVIEDGGVVETASQSLPIVLQKMDITFYPEGGDLIAGLESRVYFQALLANGKPADVEGSIVELHGNTPASKVVTQFKSQHEGRGLFSFTPQKNTQYAAIFKAPAGITHPAKLPVVENTGTVITSRRDAFTYEDKIEFAVTSNSIDVPMRLTLHKREVLLDSVDVTLNTLQLDTSKLDSLKTESLMQLDAKDAEGVLIATVWSSNGRPLAERLIYRYPRFGLNVELKLSEGPFVPGAKVSVDILTTDDQGRPVEAVVGLTVTDDTVLELIEKRQQAPRLPAMVYLENDVLDLADAHVYLDKSDPSAAASIDLLLGTQGWRRFALVNYDDIKAQYPMQLSQAMAEKTPTNTFVLLEKNVGMLDGALFAAPVAEARNEDVDKKVEKAKGNAEMVADPQPAQVAELLDAVQPRGDQAEEKRKDDDIGNLARDDEFDADRAMIAMEMEEKAIMAPRRQRVVMVREFAFQARENRAPNERIDFTETLYWNNGVKTDARNGRAQVEFSLSDSVTTFRLLADGYGRNGAIGSGDAVIASLEPFYITAKMPLHAVTGDVIELPVTMVNTTNKAMNTASLTVSGEGITTVKTDPVTLAPGARLRSIVRITTTTAGVLPITVVSSAGETGEYNDKVTRTLNVSAAGFPASVNQGGLLSATTPFKATITIPDAIASGSMSATVKVFPSPLASMEEALNALLREPNGCFEQTSSTNYPLVMAQQYFDSHTGIDPTLIARSQELLKAGYSKLISFESEDHGFEWFGANPAHEALTAYGLMEFTDMAKVMQIDLTMIDRTRQWLLDSRDGKGGFKRNERALDSFGRAPAPTTNAYIVWALLESGQNPTSLQPEIALVKETAFTSNDSYVNALAANILFLSGDTLSAELLMKKLAAATNDAGAVEHAITSITGSGGIALSVETTSLALLAWLRNDQQWAAQVEQSMKWLFEKSKAGRFGSTQSTVLALKAINTYDAARAVPRQAGSVQLFVNGNAVDAPVAFDTNSKGAIAMPEFATILTPGKNAIELRMKDGSKMPFALDISYNTALPVNNDVTPVLLATSLSQLSITEGEPLEMLAIVSTGSNIVPTPIAIIGIPAGLEVRFDQLKELVGDGSISAFEVRDSELVLYWRAMNASEKRTISIGLTAEIPGIYTAPASRIYPYYTDEQKNWQAGHQVEVVAR